MVNDSDTFARANALYLPLQDVLHLHRGLPFTCFRKTIKNLKELIAEWTIRGVDPGCKNVYTAVDVFVQNVDVRKTVEKCSRQQAFHEMKVPQRAKIMRELRRSIMPQDYDEQSAALSLAYYKAIAEPMDDYAAKTKNITAAKTRMLNAIAHNWNRLHKLAFHPTVQELRFQKYRLKQRWLDKHATRLMKPRKTDKGTILLWGDASARDGFGSGSQMGPVTALYNHILSKCRSAACNCIVIKCDEFRTSKLGLFEEVIRPRRTDVAKLRSMPSATGKENIQKQICISLTLAQEDVDATVGRLDVRENV